MEPDDRESGRNWPDHIHLLVAEPSVLAPAVHGVVDQARDSIVRPIADQPSVPPVRQDAQDENGGAFKLQEELRVHGFHVVPR
jgi:hypothetical protein